MVFWLRSRRLATPMFVRSGFLLQAPERNKISWNRASSILLCRHEAGRRRPFRFSRLEIRAHVGLTGTAAMEITNFKDMYIAELQELVSVESQLSDALLRMARAAAHPTLKELLVHHRADHAHQQRHVCVQRRGERLGEHRRGERLRHPKRQCLQHRSVGEPADQRGDGRGRPRS